MLEQLECKYNHEGLYAFFHNEAHRVAYAKGRDRLAQQVKPHLEWIQAADQAQQAQAAL